MSQIALFPVCAHVAIVISPAPCIGGSVVLKQVLELLLGCTEGRTLKVPWLLHVGVHHQRQQLLPEIQNFA